MDFFICVQVPFGVVSVPLRGKEGAGRKKRGIKLVAISAVSVPLRGKEGAGLVNPEPVIIPLLYLFPSPCGVRRVRDPRAP